ncbi:MAG: hypothetical protein WAP98_06835, partial [Caldicoprobacterales bacterium]
HIIIKQIKSLATYTLHCQYLQRDKTKKQIPKRNNDYRGNILKKNIGKYKIKIVELKSLSRLYG